MKPLTSAGRSSPRHFAANPLQVTAALVLTLMVLVAGTAGFVCSSHRQTAVLAQPPPLVWASPGSRPAGWYFRTGQWQADARTLVAALQYLVTPEPA